MTEHETSLPSRSRADAGQPHGTPRTASPGTTTGASTPPAGQGTPATVNDLLALDVEYRLTIANRLGCECAPYFIRRREALIPAVLTEAREQDADPVDLFATYARKVHARHEEGHRV